MGDIHENEKNKNKDEVTVDDEDDVKDEKSKENTTTENINDDDDNDQDINENEKQNKKKDEVTTDDEHDDRDENEKNKNKDEVTVDDEDDVVEINDDDENDDDDDDDYVESVDQYEDDDSFEQQDDDIDQDLTVDDEDDDKNHKKKENKKTKKIQDQIIQFENNNIQPKNKRNTVRGKLPDLVNVTSKSVCQCVCGKKFTIKSAAGHYSNSCILEKSDTEIKTFNALQYERTKKHRLTNKSKNLLHYKKACLENDTDILLSFRLLADWLVDRSSGRVRLLKDKNIDQRADMWKYKDLNKLLVMFHPDSATRRLTYKMSENIILCTNKVLTWFFSILNNKNGYLQQGWEPVDEKRENDKGMMLQNENRTINEESDLWDTNTREGILNYSDIKNKNGMI